MRSTFPRLLVVLAGLWLVAGCYLPSDYAADLRITPDGRYNFRYEGNLISAHLLQKIADGTGPAEMEKSVAVIERDLRRDSGFSEVEYVDSATFRVQYEHSGHIDLQGSFTFVRTNARIFTLQRSPDGMVAAFGAKPDAQTIEAVEATGLKTNGRVRVQTEAAVSDHNAHEVIAGERPIYIWTFDDLRPSSPRLSFALQRP